MTYYSQSKQDEWVFNFYKNKKNGFFIEVGAYDGIQTSNTFFLEKNLEWSGICIEANPHVFSLLRNNRKSLNLNYAVTDYEGECLIDGDKVSSIGEKVKCSTLNKILNENNCPNTIDYLSLDIEGHEFLALKDFDFKKYKIGLITVEHNLYCEGSKRKNLIFNLLSNNGFERVYDNVVCLDSNPEWFNKPYEDWYVNLELL
jgi:FkbM family methyltransferase